MYSTGIICGLILLTLVVKVKGHGRLIDPPSRATMWKYGFNTPIDYNDNQMFCGGFNYQVQQGYKCGFCGDPYDRRDYEYPGNRFTAIIAKTYTQGQVIPVKVQITAQHKGWFEFRLCVLGTSTQSLTDTCVDTYSGLHLLTDTAGRSRFGGINVVGHYSYNLKLPSDVTCPVAFCVLQWKYHAGNSDGVDPDGTRCLGCGPQEEFYACSNIEITASGSVPTQAPSPTPTPSPTPAPSPSPTPAPTPAPNQGSGSQCKAAGAYVNNAGMHQWCVTNCAVGNCPSSHCICT